MKNVIKRIGRDKFLISYKKEKMVFNSNDIEAICEEVDYT